MKAETVIQLNKFYCWARVFGWMVGALLLFWGRGNVGQVFETSGQMLETSGLTRESFVWQVTALGVCGVVLSLLNAVLAMAPRTKKWWTAHIFNQAIGVLECCCLPLGLPLLVMWFRPDVQELFDDTRPPRIS